HGVLESGAALACAPPRHLSHRASYDLAGVFRVSVEVGENRLNADGVVLWMPAVIVGDHGHGGVANLGFAVELGLLNVGHANHVHPPTPVKIRLCTRRKLGALDANVGAAAF